MRTRSSDTSETDHLRKEIHALQREHDALQEWLRRHLRTRDKSYAEFEHQAKRLFDVACTLKVKYLKLDVTQKRARP